MATETSSPPPSGPDAECVALIVAAGRGQRFGGEVPKQYRELAGEPVLRRTIAAFAGHPEVTGVRAVIHPDDIGLYEAAADGLTILTPVFGGLTRQDSVRLGLESFTDRPPGRVLIHDSVRPVVDARLVSRVIAALEGAVAAVPAMPVTDTLKRTADGRIAETVAREEFWQAQTPQGFRFDAILGAHQRLAGAELTDDSAVAEQAGLAVEVVAGDAHNIKITTEQDMRRAAFELGAPQADVRVGNGFDVHRFADGDHVTLCGIEIPHRHGLAGHSDADVGLHALTDALLGAIGEGDIGLHFPPTDPKWRDAPSHQFLRDAAERLAAKRGRILNLDLTLICESPKISPHRQKMRENVAEILGIDIARISIKATTTEQLGFTGRGEGIAGQATASVQIEN